MSAARRGGRRTRGVALAILAAASCVVAILLLVTGSRAAPAPIYAFPTPGSGVVPPHTQISFRGAPVSSVTVVGSQSGLHTGQMLPHSDGHGSSFIPDTPFASGEQVTVTGPVNVVGSKNGVFQFRVAQDAGPETCHSQSSAPRVRGDVLHFHSRPDLVPPSIRVLKSSPGTAPGDFFVPPQSGPVQWGPMIIGPRAALIWFLPVGNDVAANLQVQQYRGKPVLTWWQGCPFGGGQFMIYDSSYRPVVTVHTANGTFGDNHEFKLTAQGTALITTHYRVYYDASSVHGSTHQMVDAREVQELDIRSCQLYSSCLVRFQWDSLDHVPLSEAEVPPPSSASGLYDYFHANSVEQDRDGQLVISARNTWAAYKVSHETGRIIWRLGGKRSSFKMGPGASFAFQHDVRVHAYRDEFITLFDDGAGPPNVHDQSRGLKLKLDLEHKTATMQAQYLHQPPLLSNVEGNAQQLPNMDMLVGWGSHPYFSEFDRTGTLLFDARFVGYNITYRVFRFPWTGHPQDPPAIAASNGSNKTFVYASWNGATEVVSWRVEGGSSAGSLHPLKVVAKRGFETTIAVAKKNYVAVQALDSSGHVLGQSNTIQS